ncbi:mechanosensitive ion channel [Candidatus Gracilibacteria bacterium]|nr:mechanosensitive ion channel [Candidatus Gracilibacteria bacterium]
MKLYIKLIYISALLFFSIIISNAETGNTYITEFNNNSLEKVTSTELVIDNNTNNTKPDKDINLEEELKKDGVELDSAKTSDDSNKTIVDKANDIKNKEFDKLLGKTDDEKNIEAIETVLSELEIKKELNQSQLTEIQTNLKALQKNIEENNKNINILKEGKKVREISKELEDIEKNNALLQKELEFKEELIDDLQGSIAGYNILEVKYKKLLETYVDNKKEKETSILKNKEKKLITLFICIILFIILYIVKILLLRDDKFIKKHENFGEYFNLIYGIVIIIFFIGFIFYLFPELYALLIFISGSLIFINAQVISSFVASIILFRNFKIGDVIKIGTEKGKIIKMSPLSTIIKRVNDYGVLENELINIPNIDLIKEKVTLAKNSLLKENIFNIILSLNGEKDLFEIMDSIKKNIFGKFLKEKLNTLNPYSVDTFKTKYEHTDSDKIKVTFYWLGSSELNRKIEKEIIKYIKKFSVTEKSEEDVELCKIPKNRIKNNDLLKKASIIQEEVDS